MDEGATSRRGDGDGATRVANDNGRGGREGDKRESNDAVAAAEVRAAIEDDDGCDDARVDDIVSPPMLIVTPGVPVPNSLSDDLVNRDEVDVTVGPVERRDEEERNDGGRTEEEEDGNNDDDEYDDDDKSISSSPENAAGRRDIWTEGGKRTNERWRRRRRGGRREEDGKEDSEKRTEGEGG